MRASRDLIRSKHKQIGAANPKHAMVFLRCMVDASPDDMRLYFELAKTICASDERIQLESVLALQRLEHAMSTNPSQRANMVSRIDAMLHVLNGSLGDVP